MLAGKSEKTFHDYLLCQNMLALECFAVIVDESIT